MGDWYTNPIVWLGAIAALVTALAMVIRTVYRFGRWQGKVDEAQLEFKNTLESFMKEIRTDIEKIFERMSSGTSTNGSPIRLTELGQMISERLGASAIADSFVPQFRTRVSGMQPYEVQEHCFAYFRGDEYAPSDDVNTLILQCAFDNGISREQVVDVIALELRDRLLPRQEE